MTASRRWLLIVLTLTAAGVALGWGIGSALRAVNMDNVVVVSPYVWQGGRIGLLIGTFVAACAVVGRRRASRPLRVAIALAGVVSLAAALSVVAAAGGFAASRMGLTLLPVVMSRQVGHPHRMVFCYGLEWGAVCGAVLGALLAGMWLWRTRPLVADGRSRREGLLRVTLIETAPAGARGSMARYSQLVQEAFLRPVGGTHVEIDRLNLASPPRLLRLVLAPFRNWVHHAVVAARARLCLPERETDVLHLIDGSHGYVMAHRPRTPCVATAHDVIPLLQTQGRFDAPRPGRAARVLIRRSIAGLGECDHIIAVSQSTAGDLVGAAGLPAGRISVVHSAVPPANRGRIRPWPERLASEDAFVLHVGNDAFYKNRAAVVRVFARLAAERTLRLVLAGAPPARGLREQIADLHLGDRVRFVVDADDESLGELYGRAVVFLFPSLYEGFGWPPLEAMSYGCPVVCSSGGSLAEVVGEAALTCAPGDEESMTEHARHVLEDPLLADELVHRGFQQVALFSLDAMARGLNEVYRRALNAAAGERT